jgi:beta-1,4-mannosyltransferase
MAASTRRASRPRSGSIEEGKIGDRIEIDEADTVGGSKLARRDDARRDDDAVLRAAHVAAKRRARMVRYKLWTRRLFGAPSGLAVFPSYLDSPYQTILYADFAAGIWPTNRIASAIRLVRNRHAALLHIHWDEAFGNHHPAERQKEARDQFIGALAGYTASGGRFAWTLHNERPHEPKDLSTFMDVRTFVARRASLVHVHSETARSLAIESFGADPGKVAVIPHPSYVDFYSRRDCAARVPGRNRFLSFGLIRRYKAIDRLSDAFLRLPDPGRVAGLHICGSVYPDVSLDLDELGRRVPLRTSLRRIPDDEVADTFANADYAVLSHSAALTSGSAMLAATFGVPVIAPDVGGLKEGLPRELDILSYDPGDPDGLVRAIDRACSLDCDQHAALRSACLEHARRFSPLNQSRRLKQEFIDRDLLPRAA